MDDCAAEERDVLERMEWRVSSAPQSWLVLLFVVCCLAVEAFDCTDSGQVVDKCTDLFIDSRDGR